ncbi:MAG: SOS response-associated peptidase [Deltaproteobacteria bacterium]|nr:SOS response-associated peptidase [Deltaproteobacteria bacterium]
MCGRFTLSTSPELLAAFFELESVPAALTTRYNIAPTQRVSALRLTHEGRHRLSLLRWGLIPHWAKEMSIGARMLNARRETLTEKPAYREAFRRRRCLIPASGFYEWAKRGPNVRQPYYVASSDGHPLALAGLWERWKDPAGPADTPIIDSCTIITTPAEGCLATIHHRAPAVVPASAWSTWLQRDFNDSDALEGMLEHPAGLEMVAVNPRVNNASHDDADCIRPWTGEVQRLPGLEEP